MSKVIVSGDLAWLGGEIHFLMSDDLHEKFVVFKVQNSFQAILSGNEGVHQQNYLLFTIYVKNRDPIG